MSYTAVRLRLPDGRHAIVPPGAIFGRARRADVAFHEESVSEYHAALELRPDGYRLVALRGTIGVGGRDVDSASVCRGLRFFLGSYGPIEVEDVLEPTHVLALTGVERPAELLPPTCSIVGETRLRLVEGRVPGARLSFEARDDGWWRVDEPEPVPLTVGTLVRTGEHCLTVVAREIATVVKSPTLRRGDARWRFRVGRDALAVSEGATELAIRRGRLARLVWAVAVYGPDTHDKLAEWVWDSDEHRAKASWFKALDDLRRWLHGVGAPPALVVSLDQRWQINPAYQSQINLADKPSPP